MADESTSSDPGDNRKEARSAPYYYLPDVVINPDQPDRMIRGIVRNQSRNGFSAQFEVEFPYDQGDVVDVRVGYQRAWARVVWVEKLLKELYVVGFKLHPDEFLRNLTS